MFKNNRLFYLLLSVCIVVSAVIILRQNFHTKVYTDKEFGYSVSVPNGWSINSTSNPVQFFTPTPNASESSDLHMEIFATPQERSLDDYIASLDASGTGTFSKLQINGKSVYQEKLTGSGGDYESYYFQNSKIPTLYILTFNPNLNTQPALISQVLSSFKAFLPVDISTLPLPTSATSSANFTCPETSWVDCMPVVDSQKIECTENFVTWASKNCPDFKGIAY